MENLSKKIIRKIRWVFRKRIIIPGMNEKRNVIEYYRNLYKPSMFVETGTFIGDTVDYFKNKFDFIYSIELSEELAKKASARFENNNNIRIIQGNSSDVLPAVVLNLKSESLFWLDGHYSSEFYLDNELIKTAKGKSDTPIEKELDILLSSSTKHIILIDDARLFNGKGDYPSIKAIKNKVKASGLAYNLFISKDIIHLIPNKIEKLSKDIKISH